MAGPEYLCKEPHVVLEFKEWLEENGALMHESVYFQKNESGFSVVAKNHVSPDTTVVSMPFSLAITPELSSRALRSLLQSDRASASLDTWTERQLICTYICMHWILEDDKIILKHRPYINILPSPDQLRTPLHFTPEELELFRGSNLYWATLDRRDQWRTEWQQCQAALSEESPQWAAEFTWERYLTAATYLSSRAFPSTLLSSHPTILASSGSHPVLLPGIDSFNHARGQPVSWIVSDPSPPSRSESSISLVLHKTTEKGGELLNNYGLKPNAELILGYGFSLSHNPDDTIVLKIGGQSSDNYRFEVGRGASGIEPLWQVVLHAVNGGKDDYDDPSDAVKDELYAAGLLGDMAETLYNQLPAGEIPSGKTIRPEVVTMLDHYLEGQRDIIQAIINYAREKETKALESAEAQDLSSIDEDEEEPTDT
ncbi:SET domain-containing protein [Panus rudis PR-1116 ss-1]|nr:SET domain-containing protein [Panus rudis PR-1116 ss-1]